MVAAAHTSGLWLLRPGADPHAAWQVESIDRNSGGFEHAAILTDLDDNGVDELYVANDNGDNVNRYTWQDGGFHKELLWSFSDGLARFTWNLTPIQVGLIPERAVEVTPQAPAAATE